MIQLTSNNIESVKKQLNSFVPYDTYLNMDKIEFGISGNNPCLLYTERNTQVVYTLNDWAFAQFLQLLTKDVRPHLYTEILNKENFSNLINDLLMRNRSKSKKKRREILVRTKREQSFGVGGNVWESIAVLSTAYVPINHLFIAEFLDLFSKSEEELTGQYYVDYNTAIFRFPLTKISNERLGVYSGIDFINGQVGNRRLLISEMIWEKVCTNGMTVPLGNHSFINKIHTGRLQSLVDSFKEWMNKTGGLGNVYQELIGYRVANSVPEVESYLLEKLPKRVSTFTKKLGKQVYEHMRVESTHVLPTAWDVVRGITYTAQKEKDIDKRLDVESVAIDLIKNEWRLD